MKKTCRDCGETKPLEDFPKRKEAKDGVRLDCKPCYAIRLKTGRTANKGKPKNYISPTLTTEQKKHVYTAAILRMREQGLTSSKTTDEMLARVGDM